MTRAATLLPAPGRVSRAAAFRRSWYAARVTAITELGQWDHTVSALVTVTTQMLLTWWLWRALYAGRPTSAAGLTAGQATTYALLGVLYMRFRTVNRWMNGDQMAQLMLEGTIAYWFLRPVPPRRYYMIRAVGDLGYGAVWAAAGYVACLIAGVISGPASVAAGASAAVTMLLGLVILYYLQLVMDLMCFWTVVNNQAMMSVQFVQNLLAGAFAPLWFFPVWFQRADGWLPFQDTLNIPLSLYVGRLPVSALGHQLLVEFGWCGLLAVLTRLLWRRGSARVVVLGG